MIVTDRKDHAERARFAAGEAFTAEIAALELPAPGAARSDAGQMWAITELGRDEPIDIAVEPRENDVCDAAAMRIAVYEHRPFD